MEFDDFLKTMGINPEDLRPETLLRDKFRQAAHRAGVRQIFRREHLLDEGQVETPYSSNVRSIWYNWDDDVLYIQFDNRREKTGSRVYAYHDLIASGFDAPEIFGSLVSSPSPGTVVWDRLRRSGAPFERL